MKEMMISADAPQAGERFSPPVTSTKLVYAVLFLIVTSGLFYFLLADYSIHLMTRSQFTLARTINEYSPPVEFLFFSVQLLTILIFLRPIGMMFDLRAMWHPTRSMYKNICLGVCAGVVTLLIIAPIIINHPSGIVVFIADHILTWGGLGFVLLLLFLVPFLESVFYQGILLRQLLGSISVPSALIVSTLIFMVSWPTFNMFAGAALGLVIGIVFWRTKSVLACAVANTSFTVGLIIFQLWLLP